MKINPESDPAIPEIPDLLWSIGSRKTFKEGEIVLDETVMGEEFPLVLSGRVKIIRAEDTGREILLYYLFQREVCLVPFMENDCSQGSIRAEADMDTEILFLPIEKSLQLLVQYPDWGLYFLKLFQKKFLELLEVVDQIAFKKMDERLLHLLHRKAEIAGSAVLSVTHEQIATELGTSRVVISRLLKQLENQGQARLGRNRIELL